jgi:hypothetical protein
MHGFGIQLLVGAHKAKINRLVGPHLSKLLYFRRTKNEQPGRSAFCPLQLEALRSVLNVQDDGVVDLPHNSVIRPTGLTPLPVGLTRQPAGPTAFLIRSSRLGAEIAQKL